MNKFIELIKSWNIAQPKLGLDGLYWKGGLLVKFHGDDMVSYCANAHNGDTFKFDGTLNTIPADLKTALAKFIKKGVSA